MEAFHNLLREAANSRNSVSNGNGNGNGNGASASSPGLPGMGMSQALTSGMSMPLSMSNLTGANSLAPIHRMNPLMSGSSSMFPSMAGSIPGLQVASTAPSTGNGSTDVSSSAASTPSKDKGAKAPAASKKRKAPPSVSNSNNGDGDSDDDKNPDEYEDPKAKRRAQIAKAARKHRQRQKDELIALRSKVKDLKEQIEVLQSSEPSEHNTELGWKQEAEQHAEIRARVDQENEFLRKTLMEQMKFIQRLQDYFTKQPLLNMPSLDLILNSAASATGGGGASQLSNSVGSAPSSALQIQSSSFQDQLRRLANDAMSCADKALSDCEGAFHNPKNPTMTYFGLEVQYEMSKTEMGIFFRHHIYNCDSSVVVDDLWDCVGNPSFEKKFPFMESAEVLEELDGMTKYVRRVVNLTVGSDAGQPGGMIKEESLIINQKRENPDGSIYFISRSVKNDPSRPMSHEHVRRNQTTTVSLRNFSDANGSGCQLLWSVKVLVDQDPDQQSKASNVPDIILKNLFEVTPVYVKGIVDRARGVMQQS